MKGNSIHLIFIYFPAFLLAPGPFLKKAFCSLSLVLVNRPFQLVCNTVSGHMSVCAGLISEPPFQGSVLTVFLSHCGLQLLHTGLPSDSGNIPILLLIECDLIILGLHVPMWVLEQAHEFHQK